MDFNDFLRWEKASRDTIDFKVVYVDMVGDLAAGLLLSQIVYWHLPGKGGITKLRIGREGKEWLAKAHADWWDEIRVPQRTIRRKLDLLRELGLIETRLWQFNGAPITHIRLVPQVFLKAWEATIAQSLDHGPLGQNGPMD